MKFLPIILILIVLITGIYVKNKTDSRSFFRSETDPLGKFGAVEKYLLSNDFVRIHDDTEYIREFGIPCRTLVYEDQAMRIDGYERDLFIILLSSQQKIRGLGGIFVPMVTIAPNIGKTELLIKRFWGYVAEENPNSKMDLADPKQLAIKERFELQANSDDLHAIWIRKAKRDQMYVFTRLATDERKEKKIIDDYRTLLTERKILTRQYRAMKAKRSELTDFTDKLKMDRKLIRTRKSGFKLKKKIEESESTIDPDTIAAIMKKDLSERNLADEIIGETLSEEEIRKQKGLNDDEVHAPIEIFHRTK